MKLSFFLYCIIVLPLFLLGFFEFNLSVKKINNSSWLFSSKNQNSDTQSNRSKRNTNNQQLDTLWNNIKRQLNTYRGYRFNEFFCDSADCDVERYILISALWAKLETRETGSQFDGEAKVQLTTFLQAGLEANDLNTALQKHALNNLWRNIQPLLSTYSNLAPVSITFNNQNHNVDQLFVQKDNPAAGSTLPTAAKTQLQTLVDAKMTLQTEMQTALDVANNDKLNTLWSAIQPHLSTYPNLAPDAIPFNNQNYNVDQLFVQKDNPAAGSILPTDAKTQLQVLVNAGMTTLSQMQTALTNANNKFLDDKWTEMKTEFSNYPGLQSDSVWIDTSDYILTELWNKVSTDDAGSAFTTNALIQLQTLVNNSITWNQIKTTLDINWNNQKLDTLWNTIQPLLSAYSNLAPDSITFNNQSYNIDQLFAQKTHDRNRGSTISDSGDPSARSQLQALVDDGITDANLVRTALDQFNDDKLNTFWTEIVELFKQKNYDVDNNEIIIKNKIYAFGILSRATKHKQNVQSSNLSDYARAELQALVNDDVNIKEIEDYLKELNSEKESIKNRNLAIGLGTAGGVVALAGAGGFAYWFLKIRKS